MRFTWRQYTDKDAVLLESWLDREARRYTGCEDGWLPYYAYWSTEAGTVIGENFWVMLACEEAAEAVFVLALSPEGLFTLAECFVDPAQRGRGIGSAALRELMEAAPSLLGRPILDMQAVVFPHNPASRRMLAKAGFRYVAAHPDGDALYMHYAAPRPCYCGHDCGWCVTRLYTVLRHEDLLRRCESFYRDQLRRPLRTEEIHCAGGREEGRLSLCRECPFLRCCRDRGISECRSCEAYPCGEIAGYEAGFVNRVHQVETPYEKRTAL